MKKFAFVIDGKVHETFCGEQMFDIHKDLRKSWHECDQEVQEHWEYADGIFSAPVIVDDGLTAITKITLLEATITPRRLRDAVLTQGGEQWLAAVELEINDLRKQLTKGK